jgi:hypothetical protein
MEEKTFVKRVGAGEELYICVAMRADCSGIERITYPAQSKADMWATLHKRGISDEDITAHFANA